MTFLGNVWNGFKSAFGYSTPYRSTGDKVYDTGCEWDPALRSTDGSVLGAKPYIEARVKDMLERDGFLSGAMETHVNAVVGNGLQLTYRPDYDALGMSEEDGEKLARKIEKRWKRYTAGRNIDAGRKHNWPALQAQVYRSFIIHGEILAVPKFKKGGDWRTSIMLLDPNRLSTPHQEKHDESVRSGIKLSKDGESNVFYIHDHNPLDPVYRRKGGVTDYTAVTSHTRSGRKRVLHIFDPVGTEQTRGISLFAPSIEAVKRQHDLSDAQLKAAIYQTLIAAVIKSELNYEQAMGIIGGSNGKLNSSYMKAVEAYMGEHADYYDQMGIKLDGLKAIHLLPGEDLDLKTSGNINADYGEFAKAMNRETSRGTQLSLEQYTGDWGDLSFSGGQLSGGNTDRGHFGRRERVMAAFCQDVFELFLEELFIKEPELLPGNVSWYAHRQALSCARWMGPPPVLADPQKTANAAETRIQNQITTREQEAAAIGMDFDDMVAQMAREQDKMDSAGLRNPRLEETILKQEAIEEGDVQGEKKPAKKKAA